ncbi:MAG TPA: tetratricopeptide repeat protein [Verrucomicrobiae bacterium]
MPVQDLEIPDIHRLNAALGWLGLNSPAEARAELDSIPTARQLHPAVLEARWLLCAHEKNWHDALFVAEQEVTASPETVPGWLHRAYALRRVKGGGLTKAWDVLLPAAEKFPTEAVVAFNLACYACQMGQLEQAREWFQRALGIGDKKEIVKMALDDEDLKPLWLEIKKINTRMADR